MMHLLKRHPFAVKAWFRHSLVLTYALPQQILEPLLPPGLVLDTFEGCGFVAIALVKTERLRPAFLPAVFGQDFFLSGYRIFTRLDKPGGSLRGLRILRSDTNSRLMQCAGNLLTHYRYCHARVDLRDSAEELRVRVDTAGGEANLEVIADLRGIPAQLPAGSPFRNTAEARRFAGPLPYTFDFERQTHSIISVRGVREAWDPQPVAVQVRRCTFFDGKQFQGVRPVLANAFYLRGVSYRWEPGVLIPV